MSALEKKNRTPHHWIDLHTHTSGSDGTLSPLELVRHAVAQNVSIMAITDHDTVSGIKEVLPLLSDNEFKKIKLISGIEISAKYSGGTLHILGYGIDFDHQQLLQKLKAFQKIRRNRSIKIIEKLNQLGIAITSDQLAGQSSANESQGRPHIAQLLVKMGVVRDIEEAFNTYLARGKKAFVCKEVFSADEAIAMIHEASGIAVLAHPCTLNIQGEQFEEYLDSLIEFGLDGIEVYSPIHNEKQTQTYLTLANSKKLLISGGSDFHGNVKPDIQIGVCSLGKRIDSQLISAEIIERTL